LEHLSTSVIITDISEGKELTLPELMTSMDAFFYSEILQLKKNGAKALHSAGAKIMPPAFEATFKSKGTRGGNPEWEPVHWAEKKSRTYHKDQGKWWQRENLNSDPDSPLMDTSNLSKSGRMVAELEEITNGYRMYATMAEYGFLHESGGYTPWGSPLPIRHHLFMVEGEDTSLVNDEFEHEFGILSA
jgi:hypothetical protein